MFLFGLALILCPGVCVGPDIPALGSTSILDPVARAVPPSRRRDHSTPNNPRFFHPLPPRPVTPGR